MAFAPPPPKKQLKDDSRLPVALGLCVLASSALWGWSFMIVAGLGLSITTVAVIAWRHQAVAMQRGALGLAIAALLLSLGGRLSLVSWSAEVTKQVTWRIAGEAEDGAPSALGQKRVELNFRLHPGYRATVYSTPLAEALSDDSPAIAARFRVFSNVWGDERVDVITLGRHQLCAQTRCPAAAVPVVPGPTGWAAGKRGRSPW